jgi:putative hemolysin
MKDIPTPTLDLSLIALPRGSLHPSCAVMEPPSQGVASSGGITVQWAQHLDEIRAAQKLRYQVFVGEMGARLPVIVDGHDIDLFDDFCEHLLVKDESTGEVIGTYRLLTPTQARRLGSTYTDTEFDLTRLRSIRERMVELGRSCVHPAHRQGSVILALWGALAEFMHQNSLDIMIGCASVPMMSNGVASPKTAASIWHQLRQTHLAGPEWQVRPRLPLPVDMHLDEVSVDPPALIKGYLRLGAKILGAPAWDADFNTADLPMMMRLQDLPSRYRRHFLKGA